MDSVWRSDVFAPGGLMKEIRWSGRGGQGGFTAARLLGMAAALFENKFALAFPAFGPERRGAPVLGFTRIDDRKITDRSEVEHCDYVVVLDDTLISPKSWDDLRPGGTLLVNSRSSRGIVAPGGMKLVTLDGTSLALDILGRPITNTAMLGALVAVSGLVGLDSAKKAVETGLPSHLAGRNIAILEKAYALMRETRS